MIDKSKRNAGFLTALCVISVTACAHSSSYRTLASQSAITASRFEDSADQFNKALKEATDISKERSAALKERAETLNARSRRTQVALQMSGDKEGAEFLSKLPRRTSSEVFSTLLPQSYPAAPAERDNTSDPKETSLSSAFAKLAEPQQGMAGLSSLFSFAKATRAEAQKISEEAAAQEKAASESLAENPLFTAVPAPFVSGEN